MTCAIEYKTEIIALLDWRENRVYVLNNLAVAGWRVVAITSDAETMYVLLARETGAESDR